MIENFCTLFDSNYIDKGLLLIESLSNVCPEAMLYIVAFDTKCEIILKELNLKKVTVISYEDFEDEILMVLRKTRSKRSFAWGCSGYCLRYVMERFDLEICTYLDADLYFYESPRGMLDGFIQSGCDAAIIAHNYSKHIENKHIENLYGTYCVQFNSFRNTENGMKILNWWIEKCIEFCPENATGEAFGDQKYLNQFKMLFDGVYEYKDFGAGIAPWNVDAYVMSGDKIRNKYNEIEGKMVFYHFHSLDVYLDGSANLHVFMRPGYHDKELVMRIYKPYVQSMLIKRRELHEKYGLYGNDDVEKKVTLHKDELRTFLTTEPNLFFFVRKVWRYLLFKRLDYFRV